MTYEASPLQSKKEDHQGRRTTLFVEKGILPYINIITQDAYRAWCKIDKKLFGSGDPQADIFICFTYIPPKDSRLFRSGNAFNFQKLTEEVTFYETSGRVLIIGDMNSRVGDGSDFIERDGDEIENLPLPDDYAPDSQLEVESQVTLITYWVIARIYCNFVNLRGLGL